MKRTSVFGVATRETPTEQERRLSAELCGKRQPGSGSSLYAKGDVLQHGRKGEAHSPDRFLIEAKQTVHGSLSVKGEWLAKVSEEARAVGREPALAIQIQGIDDPSCSRDWVAIPLHVFRRIFGDVE